MQKINLNQITDSEVEVLFDTPRTNDMFWMIKNYSFNDLPAYEVEAKLKRMKFNFSVSNHGKTFVDIFIVDKLLDKKYIFRY